MKGNMNFSFYTDKDQLNFAIALLKLWIELLKLWNKSDNIQSVARLYFQFFEYRRREAGNFLKLAR